MFDNNNNRDWDTGMQGQNRIVLEEHSGEFEARSALYLAKVMGWMCVGLLTTVVAAMAVLSIEGLQIMIFNAGPGIMLIFIAQFALVIALSAGIGRMSPATATVMFMAYSALTGFTLSVLVFVSDMGSLVLAFATTTCVFLVMSVYGFVTKKDLTQIGRLAFFGLIGIIIAGIVNLFLGSSMMDFGITVIGVVVFIGLIAYDTQNIKGLYQNAIMRGHDEYSDEVRKLAIIGALKLYLDFINLFIMLLRLLSRRR